MIRFTIQQGKEIYPYIQDLARLRISVFSEYPYLYNGDNVYEAKYLSKFSEVEDTYIILVFDKETVIGALTGIPIRFEEEGIVKHIPKDKVLDTYYLSEIVLDKNYRGRGIGVQLLHQLEDKIISLKKYKRLYFASVIRPENHPAKPKEYRSLDTMWLSNGYQPTSFTCILSWKEISEEEETEKTLALWEKEI
jgi:GNAT superfamily N-acetyltransferase